VVSAPLGMVALVGVVTVIVALSRSGGPGAVAQADQPTGRRADRSPRCVAPRPDQDFAAPNAGPDARERPPSVPRRGPAPIGGPVPAPPVPEEFLPPEPREEAKGPPAKEGKPSPPNDRARPAPEELAPETSALIANLTGQLKSRARQDRVRAAEALGKLGSKGATASRALCETMLPSTLNTPEVLLAAKEALEQVNPTLHRLVVPLLYDQGRDPNLSKTMLQIRQLGSEGNAAAPILIAYWQQRHGGVAVLETLAAVAPEEKQTTALFVACLARDYHPECRASAARLLPRLDDGRKQVRELVLALRTDRAETVRRAAAEALGELRGDARDAIPALRLAKADPAAAVREAAAKALAIIQEER
jgi:HEAT repeat protein